MRSTFAHSLGTSKGYAVWYGKVAHFMAHAKIVNIQNEQEAKALKTMLDRREDFITYVAKVESPKVAEEITAILSPLVGKEERAISSVNAAFTPLGELVYIAKERFSEASLSWDDFLSSTGHFKTRGMKEAFGVSKSTAQKYMNLYLATNRKVREGWNPNLMQAVDVRLHSAKKSEILGRVHTFLDTAEGAAFRKETEADVNASTANTFAGALIKAAQTWYAETRRTSAQKSNRQKLIASIRSIYLLGRKDIPKVSETGKGEKALDEYNEGLHLFCIDIGKVLMSETDIPGLKAYFQSTKTGTTPKGTAMPTAQTKAQPVTQTA